LVQGSRIFVPVGWKYYNRHGKFREKTDVLSGKTYLQRESK
jgi:hypothetical protein